jgi:hypothetical protein
MDREWLGLEAADVALGHGPAPEGLLIAATAHLSRRALILIDARGTGRAASGRASLMGEGRSGRLEAANQRPPF